MGHDYNLGCVVSTGGREGGREGMDSAEGGKDGDGLEVRKERE